MNGQNELNALANYHLLKKALYWAAARLDLSPSVSKKVDALNAQSCGLSPADVCQVLV